MENLTEPGLCEIVATTVRDLHPGEPGLPEVTAASTLDRDLGFDSLGRMELLARVERAYGVALPEETLQAAESVADLWRAVKQGRPFTAPAPRAVVPPPSAGAGAVIGEAMAAADEPETLLGVLDARVLAEPEGTQLIFLADEVETRISHLQLAEASATVAAGLQRAGLRPRQTVAIMLPTSPEYFFTYFGILRAGGIPVPIYPPARASQLKDHVSRHTGILANAQARLMVSVPEAMTVARLLQARVPGLRQVMTHEQLAASGGVPKPVPVHGGDIAFIQYTSGSTGAPKGVVLTHSNLLANIRSMAAAIHATRDDVFVSWLPLYHDMGLIGAWLGSLVVGFPLVVMSPLAFLARPQRWLETITRYRGTLSAAPNFAYELCLARIDDAALATLDLSTWRLAFNGAEAVSPDTVERFSRRFAVCGLRPQAVAPVYGLAEASVGLLFPPPERGPLIDRIQRGIFEREHRAQPAAPGDTDAQRFVACGRPLLGHEVRIIDDEGRELPERIEGRLEFRGPSATKGYFRNPAQTARLFDRGWLDTGDRAYAAAGDIYVTGRVKDIVIRGGRNLYPQEIEDAVAAVDGIRKGGVAVFGRPDARSGTEQLVVLAEADPRRARDETALRAEVSQAVVGAIGEPADEIVLAPPRTVLKTSSGKVRRSACRELLASGSIGAPLPSARRQWLGLALGAAAIRLHAVARWLGAALFGLRAALLFWLLAPPVWLLTVLMPRPTAAWALCHRAARTLLRIAGMSVAVHGLERWPTDQRCVLVCNHSSYLDGVALVAALPRPCAFVAKQELASQFVAGRFLRALGTVFVERFDARRSVSDSHQLAQAAYADRPLLVFPEGTFRDDPTPLPFHLGAFLAAAQARLPVLPLALSGTREVLSEGSWWPRRAALTLQIERPIYPTQVSPTEGLEATHALHAAVEMRDEARSAILRRLASIERPVSEAKPSIEELPGE